MSEIDYEPYLRRALEIARDESPDPSTQNGALLITDSGEVKVQSINKFPDGIRYTKERWHRPDKYAYIEHAERNVIYEAARLGIKTEGLILVCPFFACADCARAIIQSGIKKCVGHISTKENAHPRWNETVEIASDMLKEAKVDCIYLDKFFGISLRRNEKIVTI